MTTEPKLLTEADFNRVWALRDSPVELRAFLRERGLIAEEPVDRLMKKAVELVDLWLPDETELRHEAIDLALTALRRGMELAPRKELTREMVIAAVQPNVTGESYAINYSAIQAALTEALQ